MQGVDAVTDRSDTAARLLSPAPLKTAVRRLNSRELLGSERDIIIVHAGREYRLRVTSNGKLILTA